MMILCNTCPICGKAVPVGEKCYFCHESRLIELLALYVGAFTALSKNHCCSYDFFLEKVREFNEWIENE